MLCMAKLAENQVIPLSRTEIKENDETEPFVGKGKKCEENGNPSPVPPSITSLIQKEGERKPPCFLYKTSNL